MSNILTAVPGHTAEPGNTGVTGYQLDRQEIHCSPGTVVSVHIRDNHKTNYTQFLIKNNLYYKHRCEYCEEFFGSISKLKDHMLKNHEDEFPAFEEKHMVAEFKH